MLSLFSQDVRSVRLRRSVCFVPVLRVVLFRRVGFLFAASHVKFQCSAAVRALDRSLVQRLIVKADLFSAVGAFDLIEDPVVGVFRLLFVFVFFLIVQDAEVSPAEGIVTLFSAIVFVIEVLIVLLEQFLQVIQAYFDLFQ